MLESSDWMEEEKKEDNKMAISRERERESSSGSRIYTPQKMGYIFKHIRVVFFYKKELFTFSIDMES